MRTALTHTRRDDMTTHLAPNRWALPPPAAALIRRAKIVLAAVAFVAAVLLVVAGSWPLKALVVLAFVRGLFASDVMAMRNAPRHRRSAPARPTQSAGVSIGTPGFCQTGAVR
jgi:hypothetical protein